MGLLSRRQSTRQKAGRLLKEGKGLIIPSAEGVRFYGSELPNPTKSAAVDERAVQAASVTVNALTRVELPEDLANAVSCFEETRLDGQVVGRIWVHREPITPEV